MQKKKQDAGNVINNRSQASEPAPHQWSVSILTNPMSSPTPRVIFTVEKGKVVKETAPVLPDSGSMVEIMPSFLTCQLILKPHRANKRKYDMRAANGQQILVNFKT